MEKYEEVPQYYDESGYAYVILEKETGEIEKRYVHELVAETFLPNPKGLTRIRHKDGDKRNNCVDNLEWY